jgi:hypothetical protein
MRIPAISFNNCCKISNCFFMVLDHLVGFGSLVKVPYFVWVSLDAATVREN